MRIQFDNSIYLCTTITHPNNSKFLFITTSEVVYKVDMIDNYNATIVYTKLLVEGYHDLSIYYYSN